MVCSFNPNQYDVLRGLLGMGGGGSSSPPPYLSQPFMVRFSKFFCLVKACENRHWFLFHRRLSIVHHMAARRRRSDEGQSRQYFQGKNQISQFLIYINVIYLKRTHFSCRIQIQTKKVWFIIEKFEKIWIFPFLGQNEADQEFSIANFSNFLTTKLKNGFARSC